MMQPGLAERVLKQLRVAGAGGMLTSELARQLDFTGRRQHELERVLNELLEAGQIERRGATRVRLPSRSNSFPGLVRMRTPGRGCVVPQPGKPWPPRAPSGRLVLDAADALRVRDGDLVLFEWQPARGTRPARARLAEVVRSSSTRQAGTYFEQAGERFVMVDGDHAAPPVAIADPGSLPLRPGDKVVVEVLRSPDRDDPGEAVVVDVLGPPSTPGIEIATVVHELGLPDRFPESVQAEATRLATQFDETDLQGRRDLTDTLTITIDPTDARDFDDAVSVQRLADGSWRLWVHIADVSWFVSPGGVIDQEARLRGTSVYLPGRVLPMLPEVLSNALASLQAGRVRYTVTVEMRLDEAGTLVSSECYRSAIRVARRMTYEEVTALFATLRRPPSLAPEIWQLLQDMRDLAAQLHQRRLARGAIELDLPEVRIDWGSEGQVQGAHLVPHDESHRLIEDFMLVANTAVARQLAAAKVPFLGRTHPAPEPQRLQGLLRFARAVGCPIRRMSGRADLLRLLEMARGRGCETAIHQAALRSLSQAHYAPRMEGHFALALDEYCHFTSPIRRYPDLVVHRQLMALVEGRLSRPKPGPAENFEQLGEECSFTERRAERAERMATRLRLLRYLQDHRGRVCRGQVTGVSPLGLFLRLDFVPVEGLLRLGSLAGGRYGFDADTQSLVGRRSGERLQLGDWLTVRIARIDVRRRTLELTPAGDEEATQVGQAPTTQRRGGKRAGEGGRQPRDTGGKGRDGRAGSVEVAGDAGDAGGGAALGHRRKKTGGGSSRRRKPITPKHRRRKGTDRGPRGGRSRR
jgi:ribonuclease R